MNLTTQLDAVNSILATIGEIPVDSLSTDLTADALLAQNALNEEMRNVQSEGWHWNTDTKYTLTRDEGDNTITAPSNTVRLVFEPLTYTDIDPVLRGLRVYDRKNHTYVFDRDLEAGEIVVLLDYIDLPEPARKYIYMKAARVFQSRALTSPLLHQISSADEMFARRDLMSHEADSTNANILRSPGIASILRR